MCIIRDWQHRYWPIGRRWCHRARPPSLRHRGRLSRRSPARSAGRRLEPCKTKHFQPAETGQCETVADVTAPAPCKGTALQGYGSHHEQPPGRRQCDNVTTNVTCRVPASWVVNERAPTAAGRCNIKLHVHLDSGGGVVWGCSDRRASVCAGGWLSLAAGKTVNLLPHPLLPLILRDGERERQQNDSLADGRLSWVCGPMGRPVQRKCKVRVSPAPTLALDTQPSTARGILVSQQSAAALLELSQSVWWGWWWWWWWWFGGGVPARVCVYVCAGAHESMARPPSPAC